jgi:DNA-binding transcriptional ArsR family regulator
MSQVFPLRSAVELGDEREPRLVELDDDVADRVFEALSSRTARVILSALHREPRAASDLVDVTDTSLQNVQYHLENLAGADLIEVVDTWYSERGREMRVYAPTDEALVVFAGEEAGTLRRLLERVLGGIALLAAASIAVFAAVGEWVARQQPAATPSVSADGAENGGGYAVEAAETGAQTVLGLDPALLAGLTFFAGGLLILALTNGYWWWLERDVRA